MIEERKLHGKAWADLEFVAISDVADLDSLAYLFAHGTIEGRFTEPVRWIIPESAE